MLTEEVGKRMLGHFLHTIAGISDKEYQRRVWIRIEGPEVGDFTETVCKFFDMDEPVLNNYKICGLTGAQYLILKQFTDVFRSFSDEHSYEPDFIDTSEWDEITKMAADVLKAFDYKP